MPNHNAGDSLRVYVYSFDSLSTVMREYAALFSTENSYYKSLLLANKSSYKDYPFKSFGDQENKKAVEEEAMANVSISNSKKKSQ